jgi:hypothetical protein
MPLADYGDDFRAALLEALGHFDGHDVATARRDDHGGVLGREVEIAQDPLGEARDVL